MQLFFTSEHFFIAEPVIMSGSGTCVPFGNSLFSDVWKLFVSSAVDWEIVQSCFITSLLLYVTVGCHQLRWQCQFYNNIVHKIILSVCMLVQLWNSMFHKSNVLIASHYHLIVALCLYLFTYCFHMIKQYLHCKYTTFLSLLIIFEWKSLAKPRIPSKMFHKSDFSRFQKPFVYSLLSHCECFIMWKQSLLPPFVKHHSPSFSIIGSLLTSPHHHVYFSES